MPAVEGLRVDPVQLPHAPRQGRFGRLDHQVIMIARQAIGEAQPVGALANVSEDTQEGGSIVFVEIDVLARVGTGGHVLQRACIFQAERAGHEGSLERKMRQLET